MKVLHLTPSSNGYEEVTLLANRYSRTNSMAVIEKDGEQFLSGGFIIENNDMNREFLDSIAIEKQYAYMSSLRQKPYVKSFFTENDKPIKL